jgi:hypothetical protein
MTTEAEALETDPYRMWDGAYVLGALSAQERAEFEAHLAGCAECRDDVAEIAALPSFLARAPITDDLIGDDTDVPLPASLRQPPAELLRPPGDSRVLDFALGSSRGRRLRQFAIGAGVAIVSAAAAVAIAVPMVRTDSGTPDRVVAAREMQPLTSTPITANFTVVDEGNGRTSIKMECRYTDSAGASYVGWYDMVVVTADGKQHVLTGWPVNSAQQLYLPVGRLDVPADQVRSVDLRAQSTGQTLLTATI